MDQPGQRQWLEYSTGNIHDGKNEKERKKMFHRKWKNGLGLNMKTLALYNSDVLKYEVNSTVIFNPLCVLLFFCFTHGSC